MTVPAHNLWDRPNYILIHVYISSGGYRPQIGGVSGPSPRLYCGSFLNKLPLPKTTTHGTQESQEYAWDTRVTSWSIAGLSSRWLPFLRRRSCVSTGARAARRPLAGVPHRWNYGICTFSSRDTTMWPHGGSCRNHVALLRSPGRESGTRAPTPCRPPLQSW